MINLEKCINESYEDIELRVEFLKYAQLRSKYRARVKDLAINFQKRFNKEYITFNEETYDISKSKTSERESQGYQKLSSSLFKIIYQRYNLSPAETWEILDAVADKALKSNNLN